MGAPARHAWASCRGYDTQRGVGLGGQKFDLEVAAEASGVGEHSCHLWEGVAGDHGRLTTSVT